MSKRPPAPPSSRPSKKGTAAAKSMSKNSSSTQRAKVESDQIYDEFFDQAAAVARQNANANSSATHNKAIRTKAATSHSDSAVKQNKPNVKQKKSNAKRRASKQKRGPFARFLRWSLAAACAVLCWCLLAYYFIVFNEQQPLNKADAGIILGAALWNDQPSPALKERLDYAIKLYEQQSFDYLILSGGKPENRRGLTEAEGMKAYLLDAGIPEDRLLLESNSRDTYENLLFSKRVADEYDLDSIMIITHHYHTKRAEDIAKFVEFKQVQTAGFQTEVLNESYHYTREMLAYTKWQLNKLFIPLGIMI